MEITKERIEEAKSWVMNPMPVMSDCVFYRMIVEEYKSKEHVIDNGVFHTACYAGLSASNRFWSGTPEFIINGLTDAFMSQDKETAITLLDYLMNRSGFAVCFLEKDAAKAYEERCTVHDARVGANFLVGSMTAVRNMGEIAHRQHPITFKYLVDSGCSEGWAYAACWQFRATAGGYTLSTISAGHCVFDAYAHTTDLIVNLVKAMPQIITPPLSDNFRSYQGVYKIFSSKRVGGSAKFSAWISNNLKVKETKEEAYKNPFGDNLLTLAYSNKVFGKAMVKLEKKFRQEFMTDA